jgi:hypothetical protein
MEGKKEKIRFSHVHTDGVLPSLLAAAAVLKHFGPLIRPPG